MGNFVKVLFASLIAPLLLLGTTPFWFEWMVPKEAPGGVPRLWSCSWGNGELELKEMRNRRCNSSDTLQVSFGGNPNSCAKPIDLAAESLIPLQEKLVPGSVAVKTADIAYDDGRSHKPPENLRVRELNSTTIQICGFYPNPNDWIYSDINLSLSWKTYRSTRVSRIVTENYVAIILGFFAGSVGAFLIWWRLRRSTFPPLSD